jgi:HEAT repeat protein
MKQLLILGLGVVLLGVSAASIRAQDKDPVPDLAQILANPKKFGVDVRRGAAFALKRYPSSDGAINELILAFKDEDEIVRANASDAVALIPPRVSVPALTIAMRDKDAGVRRIAARTVGRVRRFTDEAVPVLVQLLDDKDPIVRQEAAEAIKKILHSEQPY